MTLKEFKFWLQGYLNGINSFPITEQQIEVIIKKLADETEAFQSSEPIWPPLTRQAPAPWATTSWPPPIADQWWRNSSVKTAPLETPGWERE